MLMRPYSDDCACWFCRINKIHDIHHCYHYRMFSDEANGTLSTSSEKGVNVPFKNRLSRAVRSSFPPTEIERTGTS